MVKATEKITSINGPLQLTHLQSTGVLKKRKKFTEIMNSYYLKKN
jgi:hypothetical protein